VNEQQSESPAFVHASTDAEHTLSIVERIDHSITAAQDLTPLIREVMRTAREGKLETFYAELNKLILAAYMRGRIEEKRAGEGIAKGGA
jgi:hypothetical protein